MTKTAYSSYIIILYQPCVFALNLPLQLGDGWTMEKEVKSANKYTIDREYFSVTKVMCAKCSMS